MAEERHTEEQNLAEAWAMSANADNEPDASQHIDEDKIEHGGADNGDGPEGEEDEQDADDDLMDRISSSPSIDDGKHHLHYAKPLQNTPDGEEFNNPLQNSSFPRLPRSPRFALKRNRDGSSTWVFEHEKNFSRLLNDPFLCSTTSTSSEHHQRDGRYPGELEYDDMQFDTSSSAALIAQLSAIHSAASISRNTRPRAHGPLPRTKSHMNMLDLHDCQNLDEILLPEHDPLLHPDEEASDDDVSWEPPKHHSPGFSPPYRRFPSFLRSPYRRNAAALPSKAVATDDEINYLQAIEDIDFEFVYALHTFVATVEGQANATKGDTMVLLDDSNSYWWLVRVVKDGSIGLSVTIASPPTLTMYRILASRTHRDTHRAIGKTQQAQKHRRRSMHNVMSVANM